MNTALLLILVTTFFNFLLSYPLIQLLRKFKFFKTRKIKKGVEKTRNKSYYTFLEKTIETPSSYGIILILNLAAWFFFFTSETAIPINVVYVFIFSMIFLTIGLIDDIVEFFFYMQIGRWGLPAKYKLLLEASLAFFYFFLIYQPVTLTDIVITGIMALAVTFTLNAYNITDGLDGLIGGISIITFITYLIFEVQLYNDPAIVALLAVLIGVFFAFLMFNMNPAKVFFGDSGALCVGFIVAILGARYPLVAVIPVLLIIWAEGASSFLQIMSIKIRKQKLFIIAPFHLHLLNKGVERNTIVFYAWALQGLLAIVSLLIFSYYPEILR